MLASDGTISLPSFTICGDTQPAVLISTGSVTTVSGAIATVAFRVEY